MKRILFLSMIVILLLVSCTKTDVIPTKDEYSLIGISDELPRFSVVTSDSVTYSNVSLRGKIVVLVFFNTSCSDCQEELPEVNKLYQLYKSNDDFRLIGISREENGIDISAYWKSNGFDMPYSSQTDRTVYNLFAIRGIPRIYICNKQGRIVFASSDTDMPRVDVLSSHVKSLS